MNKPVIIVSQPQKLLYLLDSGGRWQVLHNCYLGLICPRLPTTDYVAQVLHMGLAKLALLAFDKQLMVL